ncbi:hypothetical protein ACHAWF_018291, partial [Thalassiosira exigua]
MHNINKDELITMDSKLGVESYQTYHGAMKDELIHQYEIEGVEGLLLSPRARHDGDTFEACEQCVRSLRNKRFGGHIPPKYAIANGFAIGHIPSKIPATGLDGKKFIATVTEEDLTDVLCAFLSPVRAFGYVFVYTAGGAHKSIRGHYSFYQVDHNHIGSVLNYYQGARANPHVYCVLCGRFTPNQREIAKQKATLDTQKLMQILTSFINESGHPGLEGVTPPVECPVPVMIEDPPDKNNTDESVNPKWRIGSTERHSTSRAPASQMRTPAPTIQARNLSKLCWKEPCQPFLSKGGTMPISRNFCWKMWLPFSFHLGALLRHMHDRYQSYQTALIRGKSSFSGSTLAEKVSTLTMNELNAAANQMDTGTRADGTGGAFLKTVTASCTPNGHSTEAANSTEAGKEHTLPSLGDPTSPEDRQDCLLDFNFRIKQRTKYPGACSLVYQHLMQIVVECLLGWDSKTQTGKRGVFGPVLAWARTDEEQGRKTLHSHWQVWIEGFNKCQDDLYHEDEAVRYKARASFVKYVDEVMCA